ncbi:MAG TPA: hypothetical protein PKD55_22750, partial [Bellilinea sp.]|nr:hypothetical protein [Bellilinea sp.]
CPSPKPHSANEVSTSLARKNFKVSFGARTGKYQYGQVPDYLLTVLSLSETERTTAPRPMPAAIPAGADIKPPPTPPSATVPASAAFLFTARHRRSPCGRTSNVVFARRLNWQPSNATTEDDCGPTRTVSPAPRRVSGWAGIEPLACDTKTLPETLCTTPDAPAGSWQAQEPVCALAVPMPPAVPNATAAIAMLATGRNLFRGNTRIRTLSAS